MLKELWEILSREEKKVRVYVKSGFLTLSTIDILNQIILCFGGRMVWNV